MLSLQIIDDLLGVIFLCLADECEDFVQASGKNIRYPKRNRFCFTMKGIIANWNRQMMENHCLAVFEQGI